MDIAALSISMSQMNVSTQLSVAVNKMTLDSMEQTGQMVTEMMKEMEHSVTPHVGGNIDLTV